MNLSQSIDFTARLLTACLITGLIAVLSGCASEAESIAMVNSQHPFPRFDTTEAVQTHGLGRPWLSDYGFFVGAVADLRPAERVFPYDLNAPLFSDYAEKSRFVYLPDGTAMQYDPRETFEFPEGTVIIKHFYYGEPAGSASARQLVETRLLVREAAGWKPLSYVWDEAQTDARFTLLGASVPVHWSDQAGKTHHLDYAVPDLNQCKNCHAFNGQTRPIGPSARQLNRNFDYEAGSVNQLDHFARHGLLTGLPPSAARPRLADYRATVAPLEERAVAYLDANCGHCHRPEGAGKTSGLDLTVYESDPFRRGIHKPPVAAGKASGDRAYSIVPGQPDASILLYRMEENDPEIAMPEVGRKVMHAEGVAMIREWIEKMND